MSNDDHKKAPQSPEEMLTMIGEARDPWEREDNPPIKETTDGERGALSGGFRSTEEGDREGEIARDQIVGPRYQYIPTPNDRRSTPTSEEHKIEECDIKAEDIHDQIMEFPDDIHDQIMQSTIKRSRPPLDLLGIAKWSSIPERPDADVMGLLHSRFGVAPSVDAQSMEYTVGLRAATFVFERIKGGQWLTEVHTEGAYDLGEHDDLSAATDWAARRAQAIFTLDIKALS